MNDFQKWLNQVQEDIPEPDRAIVDPHHHLWKQNPNRNQYLVEDLWEDTGSGHRVEQTVFIQCRAEHLPNGPEMMRPLGIGPYADYPG